MLRINHVIWQTFICIGCCMCNVACQKQPEIPLVTPSHSLSDNFNNNWTEPKPFGLINQSQAENLFKAYQTSLQNTSQTQFVRFKIKDLVAYLDLLSTKYQQEEVCVNFGQYSEITSTDPNKIGRNTVFFSGNVSFQNKEVTQIVHSRLENDCVEFLNHGQLYP